MADAKWLEVSLVVDGEYAEVVAEVMARYTPNGVVIEATAIAPDLDGEGIPVGPLRVRAFLPMDDQLEDTRQKLEEALWYLGRIWPEQPLPAPQYKTLEDVNWVDAWKQHYHPIKVGKKLIVVPAWLEPDTEGRHPIRIEPGMAFGTGTHPTTQLCMEILEDLDFDTVIDVGCGSGILSIAALKLGARHALGVDIDPVAVPVARENAEANGVSERLELSAGSLAEIKQGEFSIQHADLVLANILAPVLAQLLDEGLADLLAPGGVLVLSGILDHQWEGGHPEGDARPPLKDVVQAHQLQVVDLRQIKDWVAVALARA